LPTTVAELIKLLEAIENKEAEVTCSDGIYRWSAEGVTYKEIGEGIVEIG
jgi:hypothetical protein